MMLSAPLGVKIWYATGSPIIIPRANFGTAWASAPASGVQIVAVFFPETYQIWLQDGYDESGRPINQRLAAENYKVMYHSNIGGGIDLVTGDGLIEITYPDGRRELSRKKAYPSVDYYWIDLVHRRIGAGDLSSIPAAAVAVGAQKTGSLLLEAAEFRARYNTAYADRVW